MPQDLFLFVTAAGSAHRAGELIVGAQQAGWQVYVVGTPNVAMVGLPAALLERPGAHWIQGYGQAPLDRFPFGTMLVAPCTFNTFNKLALGIADTLATAMVADALGAGCPVLIAPSMNHGLWNHPQTRASYARLREWGCTIIDPQIDSRRVALAPTEQVLAALGPG